MKWSHLSSGQKHQQQGVDFTFDIWAFTGLPYVQYQVTRSSALPTDLQLK
jgi:hypothetical protein